jgi:hypothetical protein
MRYTYISNPNDKEYLLVHRALVSLKDNMISLDYFVSGVKRKYPLTFTSKEGVLLNTTRTMGPHTAYNMFIPETNPYFNYNLLPDAFLEADDNLDVVEKFVKRIKKKKKVKETLL